MPFVILVFLLEGILFFERVEILKFGYFLGGMVRNTQSFLGVGSSQS